LKKQNRKALIIGCGIAGPALAVFLKRVGIEAEIFEVPTMPESYSLSLSSNGVRVLKTLGLDGRVMAQGSPLTHGIMWNGRGKRLAEMPLAGDRTSFLLSIFFSMQGCNELHRGLQSSKGTADLLQRSRIRAIARSHKHSLVRSSSRELSGRRNQPTNESEQPIIMEAVLPSVPMQYRIQW